jgi:hypothetical protein
MLHNVKYKYSTQEIVHTLGVGTKKAADSLNKGALWLCWGLADLFRDGFMQSASSAGISCISQMSLEAMGAMWTDAKMTKSKSWKQYLGLKKLMSSKMPSMSWKSCGQCRGAGSKKRHQSLPRLTTCGLKSFLNLASLDRFFHFMENPIEKLHKLDKLTDAVYCHIWNYQFGEECKQKQEATARHVEVHQQMEWVKQNRKRKFTPATIANQESKAKVAIAIKKERSALLCYKADESADESKKWALVKRLKRKIK